MCVCCGLVLCDVYTVVLSFSGGPKCTLTLTHTWKSEDTTDVWGVILQTSLWWTHSNRQHSRCMDIPQYGGKQPFVQSVCTHPLMTELCHVDRCAKHNFRWQLTAVYRVEGGAESVSETPPAGVVWVRHTKCERAHCVTVCSGCYWRLGVNITVWKVYEMKITQQDSNVEIVKQSSESLCVVVVVVSQPLADSLQPITCTWCGDGNCMTLYACICVCVCVWFLHMLLFLSHLSLSKYSATVVLACSVFS